MGDILRSDKRSGCRRERVTMKRRLLAIALLLALICSVLPVQTNAAESREERIKNRIVTVYSKALRRMGASSFVGYCGRAVNNQLYYLGIDTKVIGCDGKDEFDKYKKMGTTSGGYPCRPYPASQYTLEDALNTISDNGTRDVYNILVGFESTKSESGQKFGHTMLIYAILDGVVYFAESSAVYIDGRFWPERSAIYCSIETFSNYYNRWATLDGLIWFGNKGYSEKCESFNANLNTMVLTDTSMLAEIPDPENDEQPELLGTVQAGEILSVTGLMKTPEGVFWYEVERDSLYGYVEASACKTLQVTADEIPVGWENVHMPAYLKQGSHFVLGGTLHARGGCFRKATATVHNSAEAEPVYTAEAEVNRKTLQLSELTHDVILWKYLPEGEYRLTIRVEIESYTVENGILQTQLQEKELWRSQFRVVGSNAWLPEISFDACGGDAQTERTVTDRGGTLTALPVAYRTGYTFLGWYTLPEGGEKINPETTFTLNTILYAQWEKDPDYAGWLQEDGEWTYLRNGKPVYGWFRYNGLYFWQDNYGNVPDGWRMIRGQWYHFSGSGAADTGWVETDRGTSYLLYDGRLATGQITIEGKQWFFDEQGTLVLH